MKAILLRMVGPTLIILDLLISLFAFFVLGWTSGAPVVWKIILALIVVVTTGAIIFHLVTRSYSRRWMIANCCGIVFSLIMLPVVIMNM